MVRPTAEIAAPANYGLISTPSPPSPLPSLFPLAASYADEIHRSCFLPTNRPPLTLPEPANQPPPRRIIFSVDAIRCQCSLSSFPFRPASCRLLFLAALTPPSRVRDCTIHSIIYPLNLYNFSRASRRRDLAPSEGLCTFAKYPRTRIL